MSEVPGIDRANQRVDTTNGAIDALRELRSQLRIAATRGPLAPSDVYQEIERLERIYLNRWDAAIADRQDIYREAATTSRADRVDPDILAAIAANPYVKAARRAFEDNR